MTLIGVGLGFIVLKSYENDGEPQFINIEVPAVEDNNKRNSSTSISTTIGTVAASQQSDCRYLEMRTKPTQTQHLQEELERRGYYSGEIDGVYDLDVFEAVEEFQTDAKAQGIYSYDIDGKAEIFTCLALGGDFVES